MLTFTTNIADLTLEACADIHNSVITESGNIQSRYAVAETLSAALNKTDTINGRGAETNIQSTRAYEILSTLERNAGVPRELNDILDEFVVTKREYKRVEPLLRDICTVYKNNDILVYALPYKLGIMPPAGFNRHEHLAAADSVEYHYKRTGKEEVVVKTIPAPKAEVKAPPKPKLDALFNKLASF